MIAKVEADAFPVVFISFSSDTISQLQVTDYIDRFVKDQLQTIDGVSQLRIFGERTYAMRIWIDRVRMAAYRVTVQDVESALRRQNVEIPSGRIESTQREFTILAETDLRTPAQFEDLILRDNEGYLVRLRDVGRAELEDRRRADPDRFNGKPAVNVGVIKQSTANPLSVAKRSSAACRRSWPICRRASPPTWPSTARFHRALDQQRVHHDREAVVLVVLVIFLFLRSFRATLVPLVTIPVSLIGTFTMMMVLGFSINTLTLLALVLAIGLVVDDSIVMLENISRYVEQGMKPFEAALRGSREIAFAVVAMTITLAAVYAPVAFQTGRTGRLFIEFALTLAGSVIVSGFVALTLSPMMCSKLLRHEANPNFFFRAGERLLERMNNGYRRLLGLTFSMRPVVVVIGLAAAGAAGFLFVLIPSELAPSEDRGYVSNIGFAPEGSTIDFTMGYGHRLEDICRAARPWAGRRSARTSRSCWSSSAFPTSRAVSPSPASPWEERNIKQQAITEMHVRWRSASPASSPPDQSALLRPGGARTSRRWCC